VVFITNALYIAASSFAFMPHFTAVLEMADDWLIAVTPLHMVGHLLSMPTV